MSVWLDRPLHNGRFWQYPASSNQEGRFQSLQRPAEPDSEHVCQSRRVFGFIYRREREIERGKFGPSCFLQWNEKVLSQLVCRDSHDESAAENTPWPCCGSHTAVIRGTHAVTDGHCSNLLHMLLIPAVFRAKSPLSAKEHLHPKPTIILLS